MPKEPTLTTMAVLTARGRLIGFVYGDLKGTYAKHRGKPAWSHSETVRDGNEQVEYSTKEEALQALKDSLVIKHNVTT